MTVEADLDRIQSRLHDDGAIWPRAELLRWYQSGYRQLLSLSGAVRRLIPLDSPGRHAYAITQEWEARFANGATTRKPTRTALAGSRQTTMRWETQHLQGMTPTASLAGVTQEWEKTFVEADTHFRFTFPKNHERIIRLEWQHKRLSPIAVRELDDMETEWWDQFGEPRWWTTGTGRLRAVDVYQIDSTYRQGWEHRGEPHGLTRYVTGTRTWTVTHANEPGNAWAYTSAGEAQALLPGSSFAPATACTQAWELAYAKQQPAYLWALSAPGMDTYTVTHPWETRFDGVNIGNTTENIPRGMFAWERQSTPTATRWKGNVFSSSKPPAITGYAVRVTKQSVDQPSYFCTQEWERQWLDGETMTDSAGPTGCFPWERQFGAEVPVRGLGTHRRVTSEDRQYLPVSRDPSGQAPLGRIVQWRSSEDTLMAIEVVVPESDLAEADTPAWLPSQMVKYLRYYVLSVAFGRAGEGHNPILADHYGRRFKRGVEFFTRLAALTHRDRQWQRDPIAEPTGRVPYVRLPSTYPSVWR